MRKKKSNELTVKILLQDIFKIENNPDLSLKEILEKFGLKYNPLDWRNKTELTCVIIDEYKFMDFLIKYGVEVHFPK
jgi:hypothetical protein